MTDFLLDNLNPAQLRAVTAPAGQTLVLAGPGSGKTRVLTRRLAYLIERMSVPAYDIIAVTFTNKAAREMENRVVTLAQRSLDGIWLGTFHAMCARILRREADISTLPFNQNFAIYDSDDQLRLIKNIFEEQGINSSTQENEVISTINNNYLNNKDDKLRPRDVLDQISNHKNKLKFPGETIDIENPNIELITNIYKRYQELLKQNNAVDFDDLLFWAARLLIDNPIVHDKYSKKFQHVLVDEFQDTNYAQYELLKCLSSFHKNIFVVGDEDQSIYRWRGADYLNIQRFRKDFPDYKTILLEENYRSTQIILDAANQVIQNNSNRTPKKLFSKLGDGNKIISYVAQDDNDEAQFIANTVFTLNNKSGTKLDDFAVFYRTNTQSRKLEEVFFKNRIPYRLIGAQRFYGRQEIKDLVAYLRIIENPNDEISLLRIINKPSRKIGEKSIEELKFISQKNNISIGDLILEIGAHEKESVYKSEFKDRLFYQLFELGVLLNQWRQAKDNNSIVFLIDQIIEDINFQNYVQDIQKNDKTSDNKSNNRWDNILEFRSNAISFKDSNLTDFLENISLVSDQDSLPETSENVVLSSNGAVNIMTLHAAKGLEYPYVFIVGLDEGILPHKFSIKDEEEVAEERRLFYVGLTRAKKQIYLCRAVRRPSYMIEENPSSTSFGTNGYSQSTPSCFLSEINENLIIKQGLRNTGLHNSAFRNDYQDDFRWSTTGVTRKVTQTVTPSFKEPKFKPGMKVRKPDRADWGEGIVLGSKVESDGEETVEIHFSSIGLKRLLASLANLEILN